jgi:DNA-binding XRE family transcriptional regulator
MDPRKKKNLEAAGWKVGDAAEFLELTSEEMRFIDLKLALRNSLREERKKQGVTQVELAGRMGSSQSRVAKLEAADPSASIDLLLKALLALGVSNKQIARAIS